MKAIILARVSTEEQREAGNSLPAQIARMESYCKSKGLNIIKRYSFNESAYKTNRDEFDKALDLIKESKEVIAVCFDKVDRFSRNVFDKRVSALYEKAVNDEIELHFVSDGQVINSNMSAVAKFQFGMSLGLAKYYSDAISDNVKRAQEQKLRKGEWPGKAPIGYVNTEDEKENKIIIQDPERLHFIKKIFEMYASGNYSMKMISKEMKKLGLKANTKIGKPISTSQVEAIIKNPFYYGEMRYNGKLYQHKYEPIVSRYLFNKANETAQNHNKKPFKYASKPFTLRGLITCDLCGCTITAEKKKGKYVYYSCTNYKGVHEKREYVREKDLLKPIYKALESIQIPNDKLDYLTSELKKIHEIKNDFHNKALKGLQKEYDKIEERISKMYDEKLDGSITMDMYDKKLREYKSKQSNILLQIEEHDKGDEAFYLTASKVLDLADRALEIFESSKIKEKRELLNLILQNSRLSGRKLVFKLQTPFDSIAQANVSQNWLRGQDSNLRQSPYM
ncbi:MAG: recombinase family protein [Candidatus Paceibacterota bacterium]